VISANSKLILAGNSDVFIKKYGYYPEGQFTRNLSNKSEKLVLADGFGNVIDSVTYHDQSPWPNADGNGYYLELVDPLSDNSVASNWIATKNTLVSVNENEAIVSLKIYPTPVRDFLTIESTVTINTIEMYDFQGRLLRRINVDSGICNLDMTSYSRGIYMIHVISRGKMVVRKVIKE